MNGMIGRKLGMTRIFDQEGRHVPVTVIEAGPCVVTQVKTAAGVDKYDAVQLGFGAVKPKNAPRPQKGHFAKADSGPLRVVGEFSLDEGDAYARGDRVDVSLFADVTRVDVTGVTRGFGFQGRIKRWNQGRGPASHGSKNVRMSGSTGMHTKPGRSLKNTSMAGQLGNKQETKKNLSVVRVDQERNLLLVKGSVPGSKNGIVYIRVSR